MLQMRAEILLAKAGCVFTVGSYHRNGRGPKMFFYKKGAQWSLHGSENICNHYMREMSWAFWSGNVLILAYYRAHWIRRGRLYVGS